TKVKNPKDGNMPCLPWVPMPKPKAVNRGCYPAKDKGQPFAFKEDLSHCPGKSCCRHNLLNLGQRLRPSPWDCIAGEERNHPSAYNRQCQHEPRQAKLKALSSVKHFW